MTMESLTLLAEKLRRHIEDNDGEVVYWGETIELSVPRTDVVADKSAVPTAPAVGVLRSKRDLLEDLRQNTIGDCHRCRLGDTRTKLVFGVGNPESPVLFVGEGPGFDEDRVGEPFVGKAGQLLDKILASIGLNRTNAYIANIVKCHPMIDPSQPDKRGNDRAPQPEEMAQCLPFLKQQIAILQPKIIVALGAVAARALLARSEGITSLRGKFFEMRFSDDRPAVRVLPTFHPAALLRDEALKKPVWEDMKLLRKTLNDS